jgi:hypothetical protein
LISLIITERKRKARAAVEARAVPVAAVKEAVVVKAAEPEPEERAAAVEEEALVAEAEQRLTQQADVEPHVFVKAVSARKTQHRPLLVQTSEQHAQTQQQELDIGGNTERMDVPRRWSSRWICWRANTSNHHASCDGGRTGYEGMLFRPLW